MENRFTAYFVNLYLLHSALASLTSTAVDM